VCLLKKDERTFIVTIHIKGVKSRLVHEYDLELLLIPSYLINKLETIDSTGIEASS